MATNSVPGQAAFGAVSRAGLPKKKHIVHKCAQVCTTVDNQGVRHRAKTVHNRAKTVQTMQTVHKHGGGKWSRGVNVTVRGETGGITDKARDHGPNRIKALTESLRYPAF